MKQVKVELKFALRKYGPDPNGVEILTLQDRATVQDILNAFGITHGEVGVILVNGALAVETQEIPENATVSLYPVFGGG